MAGVQRSAARTALTAHAGRGGCAALQASKSPPPPPLPLYTVNCTYLRSPSGCNLATNQAVAALVGVHARMSKRRACVSCCLADRPAAGPSGGRGGYRLSCYAMPIAFQRIPRQALQVSSLQAQVDALIGKNNSKPFDPAACLATPISSFTTDYPAGKQWVAVDFFPSGSQDVCQRSLSPTTCSTICSRVGLACDPCALAKVSCQNALYYALNQAGVSDARASFAEQLRTPPPPGPWTTTTCAAPGVPQQGFFAFDNVSEPLDFSTQFGWALQLCDPTGPPITLSFYNFQKNYWLPNDPNTYIDPATLCDKPVVTSEPAPGGDAYVMYSGLCYCTR